MLENIFSTRQIRRHQEMSNIFQDSLFYQLTTGTAFFPLVFFLFLICLAEILNISSCYGYQEELKCLLV